MKKRYERIINELIKLISENDLKEVAKIVEKSETQKNMTSRIVTQIKITVTKIYKKYNVRIIKVEFEEKYDKIIKDYLTISESINVELIEEFSLKGAE